MLLICGSSTWPGGRLIAAALSRTPAASCSALDIGQREDDEVRLAACRIHQRATVAPPRDQPLDVGILQSVATRRPDDELAHSRAIARRCECDCRLRAETAFDTRVELEDETIAGHGRCKDAVAVEHGVIEDRDARLRLRHELAVDVDDGFARHSGPIMFHYHAKNVR